MPDEKQKKRIGQIEKNNQEKAILGQIAALLTGEALLEPREQIRFLTLLKEEN